MASALYNSGKGYLLDGLNWTADDVRVLLVDDTYVFDAAHATVGDVAASELSGTGYSRQALSGKSVTTGATSYADAADVTWVGLNAGTIGGAVVYLYNALDTAAKLIAFLDPTDLVTNGSDVVLRFNGGHVLSVT